MPDVYSFEWMPSSMAVATTSSASAASMTGIEVTRIRSSGNRKDAAKSSGGTEPIEYDRVRTAGSGAASEPGVPQ